MIPKNLKPTIGNKKWLEQNTQAIRNIFPETWTHTANINVIQLMYHLKLLGVDYHTDAELATCFAQFERSKIILRDGQCIRRGNS